MISTSSVSPKPLILRVDTTGWLATTKPNVTVANRPASVKMTSATMNAAAANMSPTAASMSSVSRNRDITNTNRTAAISPTPRPRPSRPSICIAGWSPPRSDASTMLSTTTPRMAPMGSSTVPSHNSTLPVGSRGRTTFSRGPTTVGPDTTRMAPVMNVRLVGTSRNNSTAAVAPAKVMTSPTVTSRATDPRASVGRSSSCNWMALWNNNNATSSVTNGLRMSPNSFSGSTRPSTSPANRPAGNNNNKDGMPVRRPTHCAPIPNTRIVDNPTMISFSLSMLLPPDLPWRAHRFAAVGYGHRFRAVTGRP